MKKRVLALALTAVMALSLAACGGDPTPSQAPASQTPASETPASQDPTPAAGGKTYTTKINDADVTIIVSADQKSVQVDAMGMSVEGSCQVQDNVLTFKDQASGNAQIWASLGSHEYILNDDGTASIAGGASAGEEKTYTTKINDADVTIIVSGDQKSVHVDAMGMSVEGSCQVQDNVLTFKDQTSGNAQIWASLGSHEYILNADGSAAIKGDEEQAPGGEEQSAVLFSWDGYAAMDFNKDGTYSFNYKDMVKETGTWKWENWKLTVTDAKGNVMEGSVDSGDNNALKFHFVAVTNEQLAVYYTCASSIWGPALGASGSYEPAGVSASAPTAGGVARFACEYALYCAENDMYCEEFIIDEDGTVHGVVESSGLTSFEGTVDAEGNITAEVTRLGGTMNGTIDENLHVEASFSVRGSESTFVGDPL